MHACASEPIYVLCSPLTFVGWQTFGVGARASDLALVGGLLHPLTYPLLMSGHLCSPLLTFDLSALNVWPCLLLSIGRVLDTEEKAQVLKAFGGDKSVFIGVDQFVQVSDNTPGRVIVGCARGE